MEWTLITTAALMGLAGSWHCAVMCGPLCSAHPSLGWLIGRTLGYASAGALLASAGAWASDFVLRGGAGPLSPWLTLWALAHAAALSLGMWLLIRGQQPQWLAVLGPRQAQPLPVVRWLGLQPVIPAPTVQVAGALTGLAWVLLPCGLLQSALVVAALAPHAPAGAAVMAAFSVATTPGLLLAPALRRRLQGEGRSPQWQERLTRASGLLLVAASGWALSHGLWEHVRDYC